MKTYQFTVKVRTKLLPENALNYLRDKIKDVLPVMTCEIEELHERPTNTEHHGGKDLP